MNTDRHKRQRGIVPNEFHENPVTIIGLGAIGRQVALQLASAGVGVMSLIDGDNVSLTNLSNQGYKEADIDKNKVDICHDDMVQINSGLVCNTRPTMLTQKSLLEMGQEGPTFSTVFCCVDSISGRANIYKMLKEKISVFIDGRMTAESMRIVSVFSEQQKERDEFYESTLFEPAEAQGGLCTARSTIYCANVAAGMMVSQYTKILRGFNPERDIALNLLGNVLEHLEMPKQKAQLQPA